MSVRDGNLTRQAKDGTETLMTPNLGQTAGTRFLSNGDLIIADVEQGALLRVAPSGSTQVILSGIAYPNGVEVDRDDYIYVDRTVEQLAPSPADESRRGSRRN